MAGKSVTVIGRSFGAELVKSMATEPVPGKSGEKIGVLQGRTELLDKVDVALIFESQEISMLTPSRKGDDQENVTGAPETLEVALEYRPAIGWIEGVTYMETVWAPAG